MKPSAAKDEMPNRPGTIQDLAFLYDTARELNCLYGLSDVFRELESRLRERFRPTRLWIARVAGKDSVDLMGADDSEDNLSKFPLEMVQDALRRGHGLLVPKVISGEGAQVCQFTLVAPVSTGGLTTGVLVLHTQTPHGAYDKEDLRLLVLLSQLLGPNPLFRRGFRAIAAR